MPPTIHDVAAQAGVSVATVSRVLNGNDTVNVEMADRVREAIASLGYRPSNVARSMRTQRTGMVAVIVPDIENPFFTSVVRGVEDVARQTGQMAVLCNTDDHLDVERSYLRLAVDQRIDGVILASSGTTAESVLDATTQNLPLVLIDREIAGLHVDTVLVDNVSGAREATRHLIEAGATRLACVTGPADVFTADQRLRGFFDAIADAGIPRRSVAWRHADFRAVGGASAVAELITEFHPDGLLVCNNMMTLGAMQALGANNVRVPQDLLIAGYDDEPWARSWQPSITTVAQPAREVGQTAMGLLLERLGDSSLPVQRVTMQPTLTVRHSTQPRLASAS